MKNRLFFFIALVFTILCNNLTSNTLHKFLFPFPKYISIDSTQVSSAKTNSVLSLFEHFQNQNISASIPIIEIIYGINNFSVCFDSVSLKKDEYLLKIDKTEIAIKAYNQAALFYAKQTLLQILSFCITEQKPVPCLRIRDYPDFERRGFMLDISRDKVPTMQTLYQIIDYLASWKVNEFQLYTEHTFAYKNHKIVWENSSPMTADEIKLLDKYCMDRYIDLVPNQNSFGHLENWLEHDEYLDLAECPTTCNTIWGPSKRHSLDPTNPKSFELIQELYAELLPNFSSRYFNIGCDETMELGLGRSADSCQKIGKGRVYLNYLIKLNNEANKHGKITQFWGDIIVNHPELIPELPKNMIALVWGYDENFPAGKNLPKFRDAGLQFYVCPGTSSWNSLIGRNQNGFRNLRNAAIMGKKYGAKGYLNTCWGDYGHWQPLSVSMPAIMLGAAYSWNCSGNSLKNLEFALNLYVFKDKTQNTARAILKLGNAYLKTNIPNGNANAFHLMLYRYKWTMDGFYQTKELNIEGLEAAKKEISDALQILEMAKPQSEDSTIIIKEVNQAAFLALHSINLGIARLMAKDKATENIPDKIKDELYQELSPLIGSHREIWEYRNRPGGLDDSAGKLEKLLNYYRKN